MEYRAERFRSWVDVTGRMKGSRGCPGVRVDLENFPKPDFLTRRDHHSAAFMSL